MNLRPAVRPWKISLGCTAIMLGLGACGNSEPPQISTQEAEQLVIENPFGYGEKIAEAHCRPIRDTGQQYICSSRNMADSQQKYFLFESSGREWDAHPSVTEGDVRDLGESDIEMMAASGDPLRWLMERDTQEQYDATFRS